MPKPDASPPAPAAPVSGQPKHRRRRPPAIPESAIPESAIPESAAPVAVDRPEPPAPPPPGVAPAPESTPESAARRFRAREVVRRHVAWSVASAGVPVPLLDTAGVLLVLALMIRDLARLYGAPWRRDRGRAVVACLLGAALPTGLGAWTLSALGKMIPGAGLIGLSVSSGLAAGLTHTIGRAFILHLESGGTALDFNPETLRRHYRQAASAP